MCAKGHKSMFLSGEPRTWFSSNGVKNKKQKPLYIEAKHALCAALVASAPGLLNHGDYVPGPEVPEHSDSS